MKKDKSITWQRVDAASLNLKSWKVAVVGGTGGHADGPPMGADRTTSCTRPTG
jgi:hypothetical protein